MIKTINTNDLPKKKRLLKVEREIQAVRESFKLRSKLGHDTEDLKAALNLLLSTRQNLERLD